MMYITAIGYGMIVWMIYTRGKDLGEFEVSSNLIFSGGFLSSFFWVGLLQQLTQFIFPWSILLNFPSVSLFVMCNNMYVHILGWESWAGVHVTCACVYVCVCVWVGGVIQPPIIVVYADHPGVQYSVCFLVSQYFSHFWFFLIFLQIFSL